jgi:quinohemoprotein ethanol dehydrogenase
MKSYSNSPRHVLVALIAVVAAACSGESEDRGKATPAAPEAVANVDSARIMEADEDPGNWMSHGRTYSEQRYSPLDEINADNASELGLAWYYDLDTNRGQEATPIVVDGVMYVSTAWSKVKALNAANGELIWAYDPKVAGQKAVETCCDVVSRGVAVWKGRVYLGALDGRLIAIDAATGKPDWEVQTTDPELPYSITGAPRIFDDKVVIGNAGAEFGVRGYVSAYDTETVRWYGASIRFRATRRNRLNRMRWSVRPRPGKEIGGNTAVAARPGMRWSSIRI